MDLGRGQKFCPTKGSSRWPAASLSPNNNGPAAAYQQCGDTPRCGPRRQLRSGCLWPACSNTRSYHCSSFCLSRTFAATVPVLSGGESRVSWLQPVGARHLTPECLPQPRPGPNGRAATARQWDNLKNLLITDCLQSGYGHFPNNNGVRWLFLSLHPAAVGVGAFRHLHPSGFSRTAE